MEQAFARKMLGTAGLCGARRSLAWMPARLPRFRVLSHLRLRRLSVGLLIFARATVFVISSGNDPKSLGAHLKQ